MADLGLKRKIICWSMILVSSVFFVLFLVFPVIATILPVFFVLFVGGWKLRKEPKKYEKDEIADEALGQLHEENIIERTDMGEEYRLKDKTKSEVLLEYLGRKATSTATMTPVMEAAKDLQMSVDEVIKTFKEQVKLGKVQGFYDKQNEALVEYSDQDIETIKRIVNEEGKATIQSLASRLRLPPHTIELMLDDKVLEQANFFMLEDKELIYSVEWIFQEINKIAQDHDAIGLESLAKELDIDVNYIQTLLELLIEEGELPGRINTDLNLYVIRDYRSTASKLLKQEVAVGPASVLEEPVEISSGFELYGEYLKIGIKIANKLSMAILNCSVTLDSLPDALSFADPDRPYLELGNILPNEFQSATYKLKPTRCVDGDIKGTFNYFDASGQRHTLEIPSIHVRNICPFLTSDGVVVADWMDMLKGGLLDFRSECFEFKGSPKAAFLLAEDRVRHLMSIERDERVTDGVYCGYCCYFGNAKYGGYYFATTILVSGSEIQGRLTLTVYSNHSDIFTGYFHEVLEDVRKHVETAQGISVLTGKCPVCGGELDSSQADEKGIIKCIHCRCINVIPPWMRIK